MAASSWTVAAAAALMLAIPAAGSDQSERLPSDTQDPELPGDASAPAARGKRPTTPGFRAVVNGFASIQANVDVDGNNIVGDAANEPSIAVDPNNSLRTSIGWRQFDTIQSNFRQAGWGWSDDGGRTWAFPGVIEPGVFRSDPVLDFDVDGVFYYNSLTVDGGDFFCNVYRSFDGGQTWDEGVFAFGGDKQWMTIDRTDGIGRGNIYANWTVFFTVCDGDGQFTRSYDTGDSFLDCLTVPGEPRTGTLTVDPAGAVYVAGQGFVVTKSSTLQDRDAPVAYDFTVGVDMDGNISGRAGPNPGGLLGQVWIAADHSDGPTRGNLYLLGSVNPPDGDPLDVHFSRSTDGGQTWSAPVRINDVRDGWQWFATMSVAPNGRIDVVWNDSRDDPGGFDSALYYSFSVDAGVTWSTNVQVSPAFDPHLGWPQQNKIGDYYDMISDRVGAHVAYSATFNGEQDVYFVRLNDWDCNDNGVGDADDIESGTSDDRNANGIPDECECLADLDGSGAVDFDDILAVLAAWGDCEDPEDCPEDLDGSGDVGFNDLLIVLATWGPCR